MNISRFCVSAIVMAGVSLSVTTANAQGCSLQGVELKCNEKAKTAEAIMTAFSSEETRTVLSTPLSQMGRFSQNGSLEKYRQSMELNWRVITRFARSKQTAKNSRRISEAEFQTFSKQFEEAEKSYDIALNFYRQLHWQGLN